MLRIYPDILEWVSHLTKVVERLANQDPDLAKQLRRSSSSVALNTAEGMVASGRSKRACYGIALREARESYAVLEVGSRLGYFALPAPLEDQTQKIVGTLVRLTYPKRQ
jgi:four helix bundle protein